MSEYQIVTTTRFKKNVKTCRKRGYPMEKLSEALNILIDTGTLPAKYNPHLLHGDHDGEWEAHIAPDWLLTWQRHDNELILLLLSTGTHSDLFGKKKR